MNTLKILRLNKNVLQKDVAKYLDVDRTTYVKYERGDSEPNHDVLVKLADYFDVTVDYLLGREEKAAPTEQPHMNMNTIKIAGRDGSFVERSLTDKQIDLIKRMVEQMPNADDL